MNCHFINKPMVQSDKYSKLESLVAENFQIFSYKLN